MSISSGMSRMKISRGVALLIGLAGCSVVLVLAARLLRQCIVQFANRGPDQVIAQWPDLAVVAVPAGMVGAVSFAALVYGTGGLTPWHETDSPDGGGGEEDGGRSAVPDAMDPEEPGPATERNRLAIAKAEEVLRGDSDPSASNRAASDQPEDRPLPLQEEEAGRRSTGVSSSSIEGDLLSGSVRCSACGTVNSEMVPFCAGCGEDL